MKQPIVDYHKDSDDHWVAKLICGHNQHVRHDPPWSVREWTNTDAGRESMLGFELNCVKCDEGDPRDWVFAIPATAASAFRTSRANTVLYCKRWAETVEFYRETLQLKTTFENDWFVEFQLTETSFVSIADSNEATIKNVNGQGITLSLQVENVAQSREELLSQRVEAGSLQSKWGSLVFYFRDPEGHRIELWQPQDTATQDSSNCDLDTATKTIR